MMAFSGQSCLARERLIDVEPKRRHLELEEIVVGARRRIERQRMAVVVEAKSGCER